MAKPLRDARESDFAPVIDALWGAGYYNATVTIAIDRASLAIGSSDIAAFARAAEAYRNRAPAPVVIKVDPGPLFKLRSVRVVDALGVEFPEAELPQRIVGLKPGDPAAAADIRAAETRIVDHFRKAGAAARQDPVGRGGRRSRARDHGRDDQRRPRPHRAIRRGDDPRAADFRPRDRALVSLYPSGRSLFAGGDRRCAKQHPPNSGGWRRAHRRRDGARRLRSAALSDRRRGSPALCDRRVDEIFDDERTRGPGLLGRPQCVRRRRAPAAAGRRLLCAAMVCFVAKSHTLLVRRYRRARLGELSQARPVGHDATTS